MNTLDLAERFWRDGYVVAPDFFEAGLMDRYNDLILGHYGHDAPFFHTEEFLEKAATEVIPWFPQNEGITAFDAVENDDRLRALTDVILGEGWQSLYSMVMFSLQGSKGQAWHQDCPPDDPTLFNINRLIYTHDIKRQDGGQVLVIPKSHRRGVIPAGAVDEEFSDQVELLPRKGTLVILHGHLWHRVRPVTGAYRASTNYRAASPGASPDITDVCVYRNMRYRFSTSQVVEERVAANPS